MSEKGIEAEKDGMLMPTYSVVHKLFQKEFLLAEPSSDEVVNNDDGGNDGFSSPNASPNPSPNASPNPSPNPSPIASPNAIAVKCKIMEKREVLSKLRNLWKKIEEKVELNPEVFLPAAKAMLGNVEKFTATDTGLVRAMCTFGNFRCAKRTTDGKKVKRKRKKKVPGQQPTNTLATKKSCLLPYNSNEIISGPLSGQTTNVPRVNTTQYPIQHPPQLPIQHPTQTPTQNTSQHPAQYPTQYPTKYPNQWVGYQGLF